MRQASESFQATHQDCQVPQALIRRFQLLTGCAVQGQSAVRNGRRRLESIDSVEGADPEEFHKRTPYTKMISIDPEEPLLIAETNEPEMRILDLVSPIGKGQRGLIVSPPRTGKTVLLQKLANSIAASHPEVHLFMLLVDERPEEVTEMRRSTKAQVIHSSNDHTPERHIKTVEMLLERTRRLVEGGADVVILLDSLTRVARSYNTATKGSGRTLSGGLDVRTMAKPREFFGAARNLEDGGSLTIIATALIDTGSRMDDVIFEEFKGTGNMELYLHRGLADRRIWPAIHIQQSGTRKEEKLRSAEDQRRINLLRRALAGTGAEESLQALLSKIEQTASNRQFLEMIK